MLTWLPPGGGWQTELMVSSDGVSSFLLPFSPVCLGRPSSCLLSGDSVQPTVGLCLEGPEGSITEAGTDPEPRWGVGGGGALGDGVGPIGPGLRWLRRETVEDVMEG